MQNDTAMMMRSMLVRDESIKAGFLVRFAELNCRMGRELQNILDAHGIPAASLSSDQLSHLAVASMLKKTYFKAPIQIVPFKSAKRIGNPLPTGFPISHLDYNVRDAKPVVNCQKSIYASSQDDHTHEGAWEVSLFNAVCEQEDAEMLKAPIYITASEQNRLEAIIEEMEKCREHAINITNGVASMFELLGELTLVIRPHQ